MISFGTIMSYDSGRRAGTIRPDAGGVAVVFASAPEAALLPDPRPFERYSYALLVPVDGGQARAVNLRRQLRYPKQPEAWAG